MYLTFAYQQFNTFEQGLNKHCNNGISWSREKWGEKRRTNVVRFCSRDRDEAKTNSAGSFLSEIIQRRGRFDKSFCFLSRCKSPAHPIRIVFSQSRAYIRGKAVAWNRGQEKEHCARVFLFVCFTKRGGSSSSTRGYVVPSWPGPRLRTDSSQSSKVEVRIRFYFQLVAEWNCLSARETSSPVPPSSRFCVFLPLPRRWWLHSDFSANFPSGLPTSPPNFFKPRTCIYISRSQYFAILPMKVFFV